MLKFEDFLSEAKSNKKVSFKNSKGYKNIKSGFKARSKKKHVAASELIKLNRKVKRYKDDLSKLYSTDLTYVDIDGIDLESMNVDMVLIFKTTDSISKGKKNPLTEWSVEANVKCDSNLDNYGENWDFKYQSIKFNGVGINGGGNEEASKTGLKNGVFIDKKFQKLMEETVKEILESNWEKNLDDMLEKFADKQSDI